MSGSTDPEGAKADNNFSYSPFKYSKSFLSLDLLSFIASVGAVCISSCTYLMLSDKKLTMLETFALALEGVVKKEYGSNCKDSILSLS